MLSKKCIKLTNRLIFSMILWGIISCKNDKSTTAPDDSSEQELVVVFPVDNSVVSGIVTISASTGQNSSINRVEFYIDENLRSISTTSPFQYSWDTRSYTDNSSHTIHLKGYAGNDLKTSSSTITVEINNSGGNGNDRTPPIVRITYPPDRVELSGTITITADATDASGIKEIQIYLDGQYSYSAWNTSFSVDGYHTIFAKAMDNAGNVGDSPIITVTTRNSIEKNVNIIPNPGFEEQSTGWSGYFSINADRPHGGTHYAHVENSDLSNSSFKFHAEPNQTFKISFWFRGIGFVSKLSYSSWRGSSWVDLEPSRSDGSQNWIYYEITYNSDDVYEFDGLSFTGYGDIDDVAVIRIR